MLQLLANIQPGWKIRVSNPGTDKRFIPSTNCQDRLGGGTTQHSTKRLSVVHSLQTKRPEHEGDHPSTSSSPYLLSWLGQEKFYLVEYLLGDPKFNATQISNPSGDILNSFSCRGDSFCSDKTSTCSRTSFPYISFFVCH